VTRLVRRSFLSLFAGLVTLLFSVGSFAQTETQWQEEEHYDVIKPAVRVGSADEVVVTEFFWYGCGHCYTFEPMLETWKKTLPEGVTIQGSPAMWNAPMQLHAKAFYVAEVLDVMDTVHGALFNAMHVQRQRLGSEAAVRDVFVANGVKAEDFDKAFDSFGVNSLVRQADARARSAKISGTPSLMVNGKYLISARKAGSQANMLKVAEFLIQKELAEAS